MSLGLQINPQFLKIIDLAIIGEHQFAVRRRHGLMGRIRQINDRQTPMPECHRAVSKLPLAIRPAMNQRIRHRLQRHRRRGRSVKMIDACYAAH